MAEMETKTAKVMRHSMLMGCKFITHYLKKKGQVTIPGFGKFYLSSIKVKPKAFKVISEGETNYYRETLAIRFKPSAKLKGAVNGR